MGNILLKLAGPGPTFPLVLWCSLVPPLPMLAPSAFWGEPNLVSAVAAAPWRSIGSAVHLGAGATPSM